MRLEVEKSENGYNIVSIVQTNFGRDAKNFVKGPYQNKAVAENAKKTLEIKLFLGKRK